MVSLFDYLGYAGGSALGKQVAEYAKLKKARTETRFISNPKYTGDVMLYEEEFLDEFFTVQRIFSGEEMDFTELNTQLVEDSFRLNEE